MQSSRKDHSIDASDNIYGCLSCLSCRCCFKMMNFSDSFRQCFKFFYSYEKYLFMDFLEFPKKVFKKNSVMKSRFINVAKRRIYNSVKQLRWGFFAKIVNWKRPLTIFPKNLHLRFSTQFKYASVAGLNSYKNIFSRALMQILIICTQCIFSPYF